MNIAIRNILAVLPGETADAPQQVKKTDIYIEGKRIAAIGEAPDGFKAEKTIDGTDRLLIPGTNLAVSQCLSLGLMIFAAVMIVAGRVKNPGKKAAEETGTDSGEKADAKAEK